MNFAFSVEQEEHYRSIVAKVRAELPRAAEELPPAEWRARFRRCGALGLLGLSAPRLHGGGGHDCLSTARAVEAFGFACDDMGLVFGAAAHLFACVMPIAESGSDEQKRRYLPALCAGESVGANAITEDGAGSDVFALKTRARREGDEYFLSGDKSFVTNGPAADVFLVYATVNPAHGFMGITAFLVPRETAGLEIGPAMAKVGVRSTPASRITLRDCRLPASARLGREGAGAQVFKRSMAWERACLFGAYVGMLQRQLDVTTEYAASRQQFGKPIGKNQAVSHRIVDMKLRLESARLLLYRACWGFDHGEAGDTNICLSKLAISEAAVSSGVDALRIHGGAGIAGEHGVERMLRDALPSTVFSGTSEILRDMVARELGL